MECEILVVKQQSGITLRNELQQYHMKEQAWSSNCSNEGSEISKNSQIRIKIEDGRQHKLCNEIAFRCDESGAFKDFIKYYKLYQLCCQSSTRTSTSTSTSSLHWVSLETSLTFATSITYRQPRGDFSVDLNTTSNQKKMTKDKISQSVV